MQKKTTRQKMVPKENKTKQNRKNTKSIPKTNCDRKRCNG